MPKHDMNIRRMILALAAVFQIIVSGLQAVEQVEPVKKRPNILMIIADDLGWADLACYGADLHSSPNLDQLARDHLKFTRAYSAAPVCSPTRAALMTGLYPARLGITIWSEGARKPETNHKLLPGESLDHLPLKYETLAEKLSSIGYRTAHVGKWHLGDADQAPETQGFDINIGGTRWGAPPTFFWPFKNDRRFGGEFRYVPGLNFGKNGDYLTDLLTDKALEVIDQAGDQPLFLYLAHYAPHTPIEAPEKLVQKYQSKIRPEYRHQNATYAAMIECMDTNIGRVLDHLKKTGQYDNTMILFTSDNGGYLGDAKGRNGVVTTNAPLRSGKGSLYEGGVRVPLIMKMPHAPKTGREIQSPVVTMDLHNTILNVAGYESKAAMAKNDGENLVPLILGTAGERAQRPLFFHYPHYYETTTPVSAVIDGPFKLLHYAENNQTELYDLSADPYETSNIAHAEPAAVARLSALLQDWKTSVGAKEPRPNPAFNPKAKPK